MAAAQAERTSELNSVQTNLRGGNLREAINTYNRARNRSAGTQAPSEIVELAKQVRRAQSGQLMEAQRHYFNDNNARLNGDGRVASGSSDPPAALQLDYDATVAELQWSRLEAAQQVAQARVAPLHINLPTRGVKLVFSQVLQTEVRKPMTVHFQAESAKETGWPTTLGWSAAGFLGLWGIVAGVSRRQLRSATTPRVREPV